MSTADRPLFRRLLTEMLGLVLVPVLVVVPLSFLRFACFPFCVNQFSEILCFFPLLHKVMVALKEQESVIHRLETGFSL